MKTTLFYKNDQHWENIELVNVDEWFKKQREEDDDLDYNCLFEKDTIIDILSDSKIDNLIFDDYILHYEGEIFYDEDRYYDHGRNAYVEGLLSKIGLKVN